MVEYLEAWECIGCGRIEASRPCIGVCQDRKTELVYARQYEEAIARAEKAEEEARAMESFVEQLLMTTPRKDQWEQCYRAFQDKAAKMLANHGRSPSISGMPLSETEPPG